MTPADYNKTINDAYDKLMEAVRDSPDELDEFDAELLVMDHQEYQNVCYEAWQSFYGQFPWYLIHWGYKQATPQQRKEADDIYREWIKSPKNKGESIEDCLYNFIKS